MFLASHISILTLFAKITFSRKFPNLQYLLLSIVHAFVVVCRFFSKLKKKKKKNITTFRKPIRVSNRLDQGQDRHVVGSGLGPNCLQRLLADGQKKMLNVVNEIKTLLWVLHAMLYAFFFQSRTVRRCAVTR